MRRWASARRLRRLLITGAMAVVRWAVMRGETADPWLRQDPLRVAQAAQADRARCMQRESGAQRRMARMFANRRWALMTNNEVYRAPAAA